MGECDPILYCVDPISIDKAWPLVESFIANAFKHGRGDDDEAVVFADIKALRSLLWIVWQPQDGAILAAVTTKLLKVAHGKICLITSCGGHDLHRWSALIFDLERYAKAEGCDRIRLEGRKGWKAIFPDYREPWIVLEKRL